MKFEAIHNALDCEQETAESGRFQWYTGPINLGPRRTFTYKLASAHGKVRDSCLRLMKSSRSKRDRTLSPVGMNTDGDP